MTMDHVKLIRYLNVSLDTNNGNKHLVVQWSNEV